MGSARTRSTACTCTGCGRIVDEADEACGRCGHDRPEEGWTPLGLALIGDPRPMVELGRAPEDPTEDTFEFASSDASVPWTHEEAIPAESLEDVQVAAAIPLRVRVDRVPTGVQEDALAGLYAGRYRREETQGSPPGTTRDLAVQEPAVRRVVLTVLPPGPRSEAQDAIEARFLREGGILARLRHPCLAQVYDVGRATDGSCFATEEVPFGPSFGSLATARALPAERLLGITANLVGALATLHEAGLVHRCLRGDAVVLAPGVWRGGEGAEIAQIGRYGLAVVPEHVQATEDADDVAVWPPEVIAGAEPDEAADIYAVGVLLHLALVGRPLFVGTADLVRGASRATAPKVARTGGRIADGLAGIAEACLAPRADHRPTARALLRDLEALARPVPVVVAPLAPTPMPFATLAWAAFAGALIPTAVLVGVLAWRSTQAPEPVAVQPVRVEKAPEARGPTREVGAGAAVSAQPPVDPPSAAPVLPTAAVPTAALPTTAVASVAPPAAPSKAPPREPAAKPVVAKKSATKMEAVEVVAPVPVLTPIAEPPVAEVKAEPVARVEPVAVKVEQEPVKPEAKVEPKAPAVPGAAALTGLWLGKAPGGTLALDLNVSPSGSVSGRARRSDLAGEAGVTGRVAVVDGVLRVDLLVSAAGGTESYSGTVVDGLLSGRIYVGGKAAGRFSARR